jgi:hypothetical protein
MLRTQLNQLRARKHSANGSRVQPLKQPDTGTGFHHTQT